jgi:hypothetical protein
MRLVGNALLSDHLEVYQIRQTQFLKAAARRLSAAEPHLRLAMPPWFLGDFRVWSG